MRVRQLILRICGVALVPAAGALFAQTDDGLRYKVNYQCNGERVEVSYCRHDSDTPGMPRTTPQNDYCLVYYPDRPKRGGFIVQAAELRGDVVRKLQHCGALAPPQGQSSAENSRAQNTSAQSTAATQTATTTAPASADSYYQQGRKYSDAKQYPQAIEAFKQSLTLRPSSDAYVELGLAYFNLKRYSDAIASFQQAIRLAPNVAEHHYSLGGVYYLNHQYSLAVDSFREAIRLKPGFVDAYVGLGATDIALAKTDEALKVYRALQKIDQEKANKLYLDITEADLDAKEKAKPSATKRAEAYQNLGIPALQTKAAKGDDAAMTRLADVYYAQHDNANGFKWTIAAAERGDPELQNGLGVQYQNAKDINQARKWYRRAAEQGFDSAQLNLCLSYADELGLDQGVVSGPGTDDPQSAITPIQGNQADIDDAFNWCEKAADQALYRAEWYMGVLNAKGGSNHPADYSEAYFWLTTGGPKSATVFLKKVGKHLTDAQRSEIEKRAANFHPEPMELLHDMMEKGSAQQN